MTITQAFIARFGPLPQIDEKGEFIAATSTPSPSIQPFVAHVIEVLKLADTIREQTKAERISAEHLLLALLRSGGMAVMLLQDLAVDLAALQQRLLAVLDSETT